MIVESDSVPEFNEGSKAEYFCGILNIPVNDYFVYFEKSKQSAIDFVNSSLGSNNLKDLPPEKKQAYEYLTHEIFLDRHKFDTVIWTDDNSHLQND